ncbi:hypothetical protein [uncultured Olleya sp.]|uniref:hypothetical protein n=1 Tax=uncultured Olleya sp. TaxID=757243 RepID=UPI002596BD96|nr:hypothetical protein [uncultured Olleya sp.]
MRKQKLKHLLKCGILLFGISALLFNCQKEDDNLNTDTFQTETYKTVSLNQVLKLKPIIENLKNVRTNNSNVSLRTSEDTFLGLDNVITNEIIQITDANNVSTYTFSIDTDFENSGFIENLHIIETEQDYITYIMKYEPDENWFLDANNYTPEGDLVLDLQNFQGHKTKYTIDREVIWSTIPPENARGTWIEVCTFSLIEYCSNDGGGGSDGDPHVRGPKCNGPYYTGEQETCSTVYASGGVGSGDDSNSNPDGDDGTTNGGGYAYNDNCEEVTGTLIQDSQPISGMNVGCTTNEDTSVSQPLGKKTQCNKIKAFVTNIDTTYISKVRNLKNLDELPFESAVTISVDGTITEYTGTANNGQVDINDTPNSDYTSISHVHNQTTKPTYSVFSFSDLTKMAKLLKAGYIRSSKFVAFLSTGDDTHYALTINNTTKFLTFFKSLDIRDSSLTNEEKKAGLEKLIETAELTDKYFLSDTNPLIKEQQNPIISLRLFMGFLKQADMGITLFETVDGFQTFKELSTNDQGDVIRDEPCQF